MYRAISRQIKIKKTTTITTATLGKSDHSVTHNHLWGPFGQKLRLTRTLSLRISMIRKFERSKIE